jgi:methylenetetrahydrofolate dehydrogenase (NADP+)/methenyltetrahydrofolate cyclohydrolase
MAQLLDGGAAARAVQAEVAAGVKRLQATAGIVPGLATVMGGDDPASRGYVRAIARAAERVGMRCRQVTVDPGAGDDGLRQTIYDLNADAQTHGVIVLLPLPAPLTTAAAAEALDPRKDVDGITPANLGRLALGQPGLVPSTALGGMELLRAHGIDVTGMDATVVGRSAIVGKPLALLLLNANATVTVCHTRTRDLAALCRRADLLCVATGRPGLVTREMVKPGTIVLDFGTNWLPDGRVVGDVDFEAVQEVAGWISPVPGGADRMTAAVLLRNALRAAQ